MPESKIHRYAGKALVVTWDARRCIHAAECIRALPAVFDSKAKPWIVPDAASADALRAAIERCPSGALNVEPSNAASQALTVPEENTATPTVNGPTYLHGDLVLLDADGNIALGDTRIALCRCGASKNKPLCDGSHRAAGFADAALLPERKDAAPNASRGGTLTVKPLADGPLQCVGALTILGADGREAFAEQVTLCRCGGSQRKPYCDGTHRKIGFAG
jgi:CDGSH-type Zn-finger protein/uncharacterized Fe-S cluster protein YjdI